MTNRREFIKQTSIGIASILALRSEVFAADSKLKFIIPAYFSASEHSDLWKRMIDSCQKDDIIILNPNSGPNTNVNDDYKKFVTQAKSKGIVIAGYVHTHNNYSKPNQRKRCLDSLKTEIEAYQTMYGVKDIFFDEVATAPEKLNEAVGY